MIAVLAERSMQDQLQLADDMLARREIKKADVAIAKAMRTATEPLDRAECLLRRARARLLSARPDDALDDINAVSALRQIQLESDAQLLELAADAYLARFELATVGFADRNDVVHARALYQHVIDTYPLYDNLGWVLYQTGRALLADNQIAASAQFFHDGLFNASLNPALTAYCYERLAFANYYEARDLHRAHVFINKAIDTYPVNEDRRWLVQVHVLRSRILRDMGRQPEALRAAETALQVVGSNGSENKASLSEAYLTTGELLFEMEGRERDVVSYLTQFTQLSRKPLGVDVTWSRVHEMLGDSYYKIGQYASAAAAYAGALQYNPYHPWETSLHYRIARSYYQQGDYERTIQALERMMKVAEADGQPVSDYRVFDILGNAHFALGRYHEALDAYRTALQMAPSNTVNLDKIRTYYNYAAEFCDEPIL